MAAPANGERRRSYRWPCSAKDMTMQEHEALIAVQREILEQLLGQMMKEHHLLLEMTK